jgi:HAD superfamily hydrolase (TIGR01509 family)
MIEACIFDLDGTLIDTEILWVEAIEIALRQKNAAITRAEVGRLVYGRAWPDIYTDIHRRFPDAYPTRESMEAVTVPIFTRLRDQRDVRIHPSVRLLVRLSAHLPVAIVSGSTNARIVDAMRHLEIEPYVRTFVGCDDYAAGKPDPAGFLLGAERLGVRPETCLVFEDSAAGVVAAKRANMTCVALRRQNASEQDLSAADAVFATLADFDLDTFLEQQPRSAIPAADKKQILQPDH